ncbi:methionine synthase [Clostridium ganghwense]|uniref:Methionine synthase n=1 Tax=Clostridium ganghwense TaxID=312089 RepID=A0ABT4CKM5_9CLOT|nr:methionine synthase [Clostridium ganghwense]MCY6369600.1 methionine synthase [Clostridium ganghwense]
MHIDKEEVLRYLGYKNQKLERSLELLIDECIEEIKKYIPYKYTFKIFDIEKNIEGIELSNSNLIFKGNAIEKHLKDSQSCAVMAVTLGNIVDTKIRYYEKVNLTKALILDACATSVVELICDEVQEVIKKEAVKLGLGITYRYSPGYGDFSIDIQSKILEALEAHKKIGLSATEDSILIPRKSVTAVIGFQNKNIISEHPGCKICSKYENCEYKIGGNYCGN